MKSVFDETTRTELRNRIALLNEYSAAQWGKMTVSQMIKHCSQWDEMALGKTVYKQSFIGKLFGRFAFKDIMKDEPLKKNLPTVPSFKIKENGSVPKGKQHWTKLINEYEHYSGNGFIHPFFGRMTIEDAGKLVYKHADHHLRQFNC